MTSQGLEPWKKTLISIRARTMNKNHPTYYRYGGRGIKMLITAEQLKFLWFRDKAYQMESPTIDRIDNDGNYCLKNCRYLERRVNSGRPNAAKKACPHGHPYSGDNLMLIKPTIKRPWNARTCIECKKKCSANWYKKIKGTR